MHELRAGYGLRGTSRAQEEAEILAEILQDAGSDPRLYANLHALNDQLQRKLNELSGNLAEVFFGQPQVTQTQSQSQA